jgi:hypothetical protein
MQSLDVVDQLNARLEVLEATLCSYTGPGAAPLRDLDPDIVSSIFWGFQLTVGDCRELVSRLHESKLTGGQARTPATNPTP